MMIALLTLALAQEGVDHVPAEASVPGWQVAEATPPLFDFDRTVDEAIRLRQAGDLRGAATLLEGLGGLVPPQSVGWWLYQRGICAELQWDFTGARALYEDVVARNGDHVADARFRLALVLEDLGDPQGAMEQIRALAKLRGLEEDDQLTLDLQAAVTAMNLGATKKRLKQLDAAITRGDAAGGHTWVRAKARYRLAAHLLAEADAMRLDGPEKRVVKRLKARIDTITHAERQITTLVKLEEPEWIVASLIALGESWKRLGDDLEASPTPARLSEAEAVVYRQQLGPYAENARTKAFHYWDSGVELAHRVGFESPKVQVLKERRDSLAR